jgi:hypothetical protein
MDRTVEAVRIDATPLPWTRGATPAPAKAASDG